MTLKFKKNNKKPKTKTKAFSIERNENRIVQHAGPHYPSSPLDGSTAVFCSNNKYSPQGNIIYNIPNRKLY